MSLKKEEEYLLLKAGSMFDQRREEGYLHSRPHFDNAQIQSLLSLFHCDALASPFRSVQPLCHSSLWTSSLHHPSLSLSLSLYLSLYLSIYLSLYRSISLSLYLSLSPSLSLSLSLY